ncbi:hypothetical protein, partial [Stutzerimonas stutzeri]|uniref:hypothetical protein n=1 Tax=Stutzerimonas stutzeri TaxID=316 RepID=UPI0026598D92
HLRSYVNRNWKISWHGPLPAIAPIYRGKQRWAVELVRAFFKLPGTAFTLAALLDSPTNLYAAYFPGTP